MLRMNIYRVVSNIHPKSIILWKINQLISGNMRFHTTSSIQKAYLKTMYNMTGYGCTSSVYKYIKT